MNLVPEWKSLWRSWSMGIAAVGAVLPSIAELIADHTELIPHVDDATKNGIRLVCLILVIVLRPIKQESLHKDGP